MLQHRALIKLGNVEQVRHTQRTELFRDGIRAVCCWFCSSDDAQLAPACPKGTEEVGRGLSSKKDASLAWTQDLVHLDSLVKIQSENDTGTRRGPSLDISQRRIVWELVYTTW
mmetsp:Transcript_22900/g.54121  ORF Transcript_22900/g.54121 Transcript_22900/m.54121 type:complete len:113 (+) Transcript_22900:160-498(+)